MSVGWNFEKRRDTCTQFLIGVFVLAEGRADYGTSLEKVRNRMRLSPEEALFAARKLNEDKLLAFETGGVVRSNARGLERADALIAAVRAKTKNFAEVAKTLRTGGTPADVLAAVVRENGGTLACGAPDVDPHATYQLMLSGEVLTVERQRADGTFEAPPDALG